jgi:hypothetical protein
LYQFQLIQTIVYPDFTHSELIENDTIVYPDFTHSELIETDTIVYPDFTHSELIEDNIFALYINYIETREGFGQPGQQLFTTAEKVCRVGKGRKI